MGALWAFFALLTMAAGSVAYAQEDYLDPADAFVISATVVAPDTLVVQFDVADRYYLYRERLGWHSEPQNAVDIIAPDLPPGVVKYDSTFERDMEVYHHQLVAHMTLPSQGQPFTLAVEYQGCADAGLCYPPMVHRVALVPSDAGWAVAGVAPDGQPMQDAASGGGDGGGGAILSWLRKEASAPSALVGAPGPARADAGALTAPTGVAAMPEASDRDQPLPDSSAASARSFDITQLVGSDDLALADALGGLAMWQTLPLFFVLGLLLALTPCVLPMVPILSGMVIRDAAGQKPSRKRGLALAAAYVAGMAVVYTALGTAAGLSGVGLAAWLQKPWVLTLFALLLFVLALATFGAFTLQMPAAVQARLSAYAGRTRRGRLSGAAAMGALSALIVGPCVAAPLAGVLIYISQTGNAWAGGSALFAMAWGMGMPLLLVGASASTWLPRSGPWMTGVTRLFGMLLLGTALYLMLSVLRASVLMLAWAVWASGAAVMLWSAGQAAVTLGMFARGLALVVGLIAAAWVAGALSGGQSLLRPLSHWVSVGQPHAGAATMLAGTTASLDPNVKVVAGLSFQRVRNEAELDAILATADHPIMLDFYADWCVSCHEMIRLTFPDPAVQARLQGMTLLVADVTAHNAHDRALLKRFRLFGPPGIIFFDAQGTELERPRVIGFQSAERFARALDQLW
jgi:thiol:disulfide interchange protein DsbD